MPSTPITNFDVNQIPSTADEATFHADATYVFDHMATEIIPKINTNMDFLDSALGGASTVVDSVAGIIDGSTNLDEVNVSSATDAKVDITHTNGVLGGAIMAVVNFFAGATRHGLVGFDTINGTMNLFNNDGRIHISNGSTDPIELRPNGTASVSATTTGVTLTGFCYFNGPAQVEGDLIAPALYTRGRRGCVGFFLYEGTTTLLDGDTTSGGNLKFVSIKVKPASGGGSGGSVTTTGITVNDIDTGSSPSGTWACIGYAPEDSLCSFVRVS